VLHALPIAENKAEIPSLDIDIQIADLSKVFGPCKIVSRTRYVVNGSFPD